MMKALIGPKSLAAIFCTLLAVWLTAAPLAAVMLVADKDIDRPDAILVLAGSAVYRERNAHAAKLFAEGRAPLVVLTNDAKRSGWSDEAGTNPRFVELAKAELVSQGVPEDRIRILEPKVTGTIVEARLIAASAERLGLRRLLIVTSSYHSARALRTFEEVIAKDAAPLEVGISPVPTGVETPSYLTWWLSVRGWRFVAGEYAKSVYYETLL